MTKEPKGPQVKRATRAQTPAASILTDAGQWKTTLNITKDEIWQKFMGDCHKAYKKHIAPQNLVDPLPPEFQNHSSLKKAQQDMVDDWQSQPVFRSNSEQDFRAAISSVCWQYLKDDREETIKQNAADAKKAMKDAKAFSKGRPPTENEESGDTEADSGDEIDLRQIKKSRKPRAKRDDGDGAAEDNDAGSIGSEITPVRSTEHSNSSSVGDDDSTESEAGQETEDSQEESQDSDEDAEEEDEEPQPVVPAAKKARRIQIPGAKKGQPPPNLGIVRDYDKETQKLRRRWREEVERTSTLRKLNYDLRNENEKFKEAHKRFRKAIKEDMASIKVAYRMVQQDLKRKLEDWVESDSSASEAENERPRKRRPHR